ncbi:MAG: hypothetical protein AB7N76_20180 [Planctomycetota bacterium]
MRARAQHRPLLGPLLGVCLLALGCAEQGAAGVEYATCEVYLSSGADEQAEPYAAAAAQHLARTDLKELEQEARRRAPAAVPAEETALALRATTRPASTRKLGRGSTVRRGPVELPEGKRFAAELQLGARRTVDVGVAGHPGTVLVHAVLTWMSRDTEGTEDVIFGAVLFQTFLEHLSADLHALARQRGLSARVFVGGREW